MKTETQIAKKLDEICSHPTDELNVEYFAGWKTALMWVLTKKPDKEEK